MCRVNDVKIYIFATDSIKHGRSFLVRNMKRMRSCFKPAFYMKATRWRWLWLPMEMHPLELFPNKFMSSVTHPGTGWIKSFKITLFFLFCFFAVWNHYPHWLATYLTANEHAAAQSDQPLLVTSIFLKGKWQQSKRYIHLLCCLFF